jgi:hypothetical protein
MKMILIVLGVIVVLAIGAFALLVYLFSGGPDMTRAQWDVWRRGYEADRDIVIGNAVRMKLPRGFRGDSFRSLPDIREFSPDRPFAHELNDQWVEFHARLGYYVPINNKEWSALAVVEFAAPGAAALPPVEKGWHDSKRIGCVAESAGRRVRFSAYPNIYNAEQCQKIADAALQSLRPDEAAIAAMFERRRSRLAAQPANRKAAWDFLERRGFRPLPAAETPVRNAEGDVMFLHEGLGEAVLWFKLAEIPVADFDAIRDDAATVKGLILQPNVSNGLMLTRRQVGELKRYRLASEVAPVEDPVYGANQLVTPLLTEATREGFVVLWRNGSVWDFADSGAAMLEVWFADSDRLRKAQPAGWRRAR